MFRDSPMTHWNRRLVAGYLTIAAMLLLAGSVVATRQEPAQRSRPDGLPDGPGKAELIKICSDCHEVTKATTVRLTRAGWASVIDDMVKGGATGTEKELELVLTYLSTNFLGEAARPINVNTAPALDLESVLGLLRSEARALIAYREKSGPCKVVDDLKKVPGLDFKKVDAARDRIVCF